MSSSLIPWSIGRKFRTCSLCRVSTRSGDVLCSGIRTRRLPGVQPEFNATECRQISRDIGTLDHSPILQIVVGHRPDQSDRTVSPSPDQHVPNKSCHVKYRCFSKNKNIFDKMSIFLILKVIYFYRWPWPDLCIDSSHSAESCTDRRGTCQHHRASVRIRHSAM